jgi:hypothetical protein
VGGDVAGRAGRGGAELQAWNDACKANPLLTYFPHQGELEWKLKEQTRQLDRWASKGFEIVVGEGAGGSQYSARSPDGELVGMPAELLLDGASRAASSSSTSAR